MSQPPTRIRYGLILAGGASRRMGREKATLPWKDKQGKTRKIEHTRAALEPPQSDGFGSITSTSFSEMESKPTLPSLEQNSSATLPPSESAILSALANHSSPATPMTFLSRCFQLLQPVTSRILLSARQEQWDRWMRKGICRALPPATNTHRNMAESEGDISNSKVTFIPDQLDCAGPLRGLLSAGLYLESRTTPVSENEAIMVLAVDMPDIAPGYLESLAKGFSFQESQGIFFKTQSGLEPLCGIYRATLLLRWLDRFRKSALPTYSARALLEQESIEVLTISEKDWNDFRSMNSPKDLKARDSEELT